MATKLRALVAATAVAVALVPAAGSTAGAQTSDDLLTAFDAIGVAPDVAAALVGGSLSDATGDTFRYAVPGSRPATLTEAYVDILRTGAAEVSWGDTPPTVACGRGDDVLVVCAANPPDLHEPHAVFWMQTAGDLPTDPDLSASLAFPVLTPGGAPWVAQGPFQWDTFQGTDRWHDLNIRPDTDWQVVVQRFTGDEVEVEPSSAFAVLEGDSVVMAVPLRELLTPFGQAPSTDAPTGDPWRWGAALHFHDGTYGSSPSDTSGVDSYPDTDGETPRGPDQLALPTSDPVVALPPSDEPSVTTTIHVATPSPTPTSTTDDGGVPWGLILVGLIVLAGGAIAIGTRERTPPVPPCDCTVAVTIEGPDGIGRCCIAATTWALHGVEATDAEEATRDPARIHVDGDDTNGRDVTDLLLSAAVTASCSGGGTARVADATYDWSITSDDTGIAVTVTVSVPVDCPGAAEHADATATATHRLPFHDAPCLIGVIVEQTGTFEISHVDVQIVCGEYSEIFGYFPAGARSFGNTIAGAPAQVIRTSGARAQTGRIGLTTRLDDQIGSDYATSHGGKKLKVYWIEPEDCSVCQRLRDFWENLAANPGTYYLLSSNCATTAWQSLTDSGAFPATPRPSDAPNTPGGIEARLRLDHDAGGGHVTDISEIR